MKHFWKTLSRVHSWRSVVVSAFVIAGIAVAWTTTVEYFIYKGDAWFFGGWRIAAEAFAIFVATGVMSMWLAYRVSTERRRYERELERVNRHLQELAITDSMTGAHNHRFFQMKLEQEWARMRRFGHALTCVMIDLDNFKQLNDTYGHQAGDVVLQGVADILHQELRTVDVISRYGGEEFVVIMLEKPAHKMGLLKAMDRIRIAVEEAKFVFNGQTIHATASFGGALAPDPALTTPDALVHAADEAMYEAKRTGKNRCVVWGMQPRRSRTTATKAKAAQLR